MEKHRKVVDRLLSERRRAVDLVSRKRMPSGVKRQMVEQLEQDIETLEFLKARLKADASLADLYGGKH